LLDLPEFITAKLSRVESNKFGIIVKVLGFNSKKFDIIIFINYISDKKIKIDRSLGTSSGFKSLLISHEDFPFQLQFIDLKAFFVFAKKFANVKENKKWSFPYEIIRTDNHIEILSETKPFEHIDFYSTPKGKNISEKEYFDYLTLNQQFSNRLEYFLAYNKQDIIIMIPIIEKLIKGFADQNVDMLRNISLSACASQAKFAILYENFDIDGDYSVNSKTTFIATEEWFKDKIENYTEQDKKAKRDSSKNITMIDWPYFKELFENEKCYICEE
jgi:hypothetical protein